MERDKERKGERCRIWLLNFFILTGMIGALALFSYLVPKEEVIKGCDYQLLKMYGMAEICSAF